MTDDSIKKHKGGRPKKRTLSDVQRSFWVNPELWDAADGLPVPRPDIIREALLNAVSMYKTDIHKLRWQLEEVEAQEQVLAARKATLVSLIKKYEDEQILIETEQIKSAASKEQAVQETMRLTRIFKKKMTHEHLSIISGLSGLDAAKIEVFLVDTHYRPTEEQVRALIR